MMNIKYIKSTAVLSFGLLIASCSGSFLDEKPNGYINNDQIEENAKWNSNIMLGVAAGTAQKTFSNGTGGTTNHDDFGQKSVDIATDLMSGDMVLRGTTYGWFSSDAQLQNSTKDKDRAYMIWRYYFQIIKAANAVFDNLGGDENMPEEGDNRTYYGQAKAFRAYAYLNLVNLYARPYDEAKDTKALPIYRSQLTNAAATLSTVDEVYTFVINDLKEAITALQGTERNQKKGTTGEIKDVADEYVAGGLLAYAYLQKGDYAEAAKAAKTVIDGGKYTMLTESRALSTGFNSDQLEDFMWAIDLTTDNSPALPTFWGQVDIFTYSYAAAGDAKVIPDNLYEQIPETDCRKKWFIGGEKYSAPLAPTGKFYDSAKQFMGNRRWDEDEVYMRLEEMYLILSEASVRNNDLATGRTALKALLENRDATVAATVDQMDKETLLKQLYYNWRVEMWGEGRGLMTMKRFKATVTRGSNDVTPLANKEIKWDDSRLYFAIPERETTNNPNIK